MFKLKAAEVETAEENPAGRASGDAEHREGQSPDTPEPATQA